MSEQQHPDSRAFEHVADLYERARPGYPPAAVAWIAERLALGPGRTILDLGAGTGKLTRDLVATGARVVAVEPGDEMRARLAEAVPGVEALAGAGESIPLPDSSVDGVTVAQAFHWFRADEALREIHRVIRPGGRLALIWNERDPDDELQRSVSELLKPFYPPQRPRVIVRGREALEASPLFGAVEEGVFRFADELDADGLAERIATISFVASAPASRGAELARRVCELAAERGGRVHFPYVTRVFVSAAETRGTGPGPSERATDAN